MTIGNSLRQALFAIPVVQQDQERQRLNRLREQTFEQGLEKGRFDLDAARSQQKAEQRQAEKANEIEKARITDRLIRGLRDIEDPQQRLDALNSQIPALQKFDFDRNDLELLYDPDPVVWNQKLDTLRRANSAFLTEKNLTSGQQEFRDFSRGLSDQDVQKARRIKLGLDPRATGSAAQTILNLGTAQQVADVEKTLAGGKEQGKLEAQFKWKPQIQKAVKLAEAKAKDRGEALSDLNRMNAALPGLNDVVGQLKKLAPIATHTLTGRAADLLLKELGFGSTEGSTARKKFISIINNQVLPLLKPTFGGSFTVAEGDALKATMGDPNSTPEEKIAELESFIDNKFREIESKERQIGSRPQGQLMEDANGNRAIVYPDGTFEEIN